MKIIGILNSGSPDLLGEQFVAFHRGLEEAGYVDGENVVVEYHWANNNYVDLRTMADGLAGRRDVAVIVAAGGTVSAQKARDATTAAVSIEADRKPVVFTAVTDPRPGHSDLRRDNMTGMHALTSELDPKRLELLHAFKPTDNVGVLVNSKRGGLPEQVQNLKDKAVKLGVNNLQIQSVENEAGIESAFSYLGQQGVQALLVTADPFFNSQRAKIIAGATGLRVPAIYQWSGFVAAGGLMSYGPRITDAYRLAGVYAGRILAGTAVRDLRVVPPTRLDLVINIKGPGGIGGMLPDLLASAFKPPPEQPNAEIVVTLRSNGA
jgi:putative tryptophan/tyrosine transport system substrate-binding protein